MISVIIPLYNKADTIQRTLDSVYSQTLQDFEVIVVDDQSTDQGPQIVNAQKDSRVKLVSRPNGGQGAARNTGMEAARGDYFAFLDSDDAWETTHLENLLSLHRDFPHAEVFATGYAMVGSDGSVKRVGSGIPRGTIDYFRQFAMKETPVLTCSSTMITRSAVDKVGLIDQSIRSGGDLHYWARLALQCEVAFEPSVSMSYYFETVGNLSQIRHRSKDPGTVISPSVDYLQRQLRERQVLPCQKDSVNLYVQATVLKAVKAALARGDSRRAREVLRIHWSKRHFVKQGLAYTALALAPGAVSERFLQLWRSYSRPAFSVLQPGNFEGVADVALFIPNLRTGGAERVAVTLVNLLSQRVKVEVVVLGSEGELLVEMSPAIRLVRLGAKHLRLRELAIPTLSYVRLGRFRQAVCFLAPWHHLIPLACRVLGRPFPTVVSIRGFPPSRQEIGDRRYLFERLMMRTSLRLADKIVPISEALEKHLAENYEMNLSKSTVIHNPVGTVRTEDVVPNEQIWEWWVRPPAKRLLAVGNLRPVKDHATLIRAFAKVTTEADAKLLILGRGGQQQTLQALIDSLGLGQRVQLGGYIENVTPFQASADLLVHSSLSEGFSNSVLEALKQGVNVVTTASGGPEEILDHGKFGRIVPVADANAMASAILATLSDPLASDVLKSRAEHFSLDAFHQKWTEVLCV